MDIITLALAKKGAKAYTDQKVAQLASGIKYMGSVSYYTNLPNNLTEDDIGTVYTVLYSGTSGSVEDGTEYIWTKNEQGELLWVGLAPDLTPYLKKTEASSTYYTSADATILSGRVSDLEQAVTSLQNSLTITLVEEEQQEEPVQEEV